LNNPQAVTRHDVKDGLLAQRLVADVLDDHAIEPVGSGQDEREHDEPKDIGSDHCNQDVLLVVIMLQSYFTLVPKANKLVFFFSIFVKQFFALFIII
jgi:hypothetical protein